MGNGGGPSFPILTPLEVAELYNFPTGPTTAHNQTIGIVSASEAYWPSDIKQNFGPTGPGYGLVEPEIVFPDDTLPAPDTSKASVPDEELTMDITIIGSVAQGAVLAVYPCGENTIAALTAAIHPTTEPKPSVISISWDGLEDSPMDDPSTATMASLFADAATLGVTILVASGDGGASCRLNDGEVHVLYPACDVGVLSCGGTMITTVSGAAFDESTWNDSVLQKDPDLGATGGGVSRYFPLPSWQADAKVPVNFTTGYNGRGLPDVAGNASGMSAYKLVYGGIVTTNGGTSAVAPLYAGLMAIVNAAMGSQVGFVNPVLYKLGGTGIFRDINDGQNNQLYGYMPAAPYVSGPGWDPCTGWGSINGKNLIQALKQMKARSAVQLTSWYGWTWEGEAIAINLRTDNCSKAAPRGWGSSSARTGRAFPSNSSRRSAGKRSNALPPVRYVYPQRKNVAAAFRGLRRSCSHLARATIPKKLPVA